MKINNTSIDIKSVKKQVHLQGWVNKKRNLGGIIFIDLRDRSGIIQLVINPLSKAYLTASTLKNEYVISVNGQVSKRKQENKNLITGQIEVIVDQITILNESEELPFDLNNTTALEDTRLTYRYLDLRRTELQNNIMLRHKIVTAIRDYLNKQEFIEIETPILCKSTPEGARDFLVPSRINKGHFYALPQSPQLFKQLLMVSGFEKYYQIAKCFRDEDLRKDRQPEFTQIDLEMSFITEEDIMKITEGIIQTIMSKIKNIDIALPLQKMTYKDAMNIYGSDKPDTRFDMKINDITEIFQKTDFTIFKQIIENNGIINAIVVKNAADKYSRKQIDKLTEYVKIYKANALAFLKYNETFTGSISKFITDEISKKLIKTLNLENNDLVFIIAGNYKIVKTSLGYLRTKLAADLNLIDQNKFNFLWITDFPIFEYSEEEKRYIACHHPFTSPKDEWVDKLDDKQNALAKAYDIVLNGYEIGGGSIRIHKKDIQEKMFRALGLTDKQITEKFGFLIEAFKYGTPPHGGLAFGLERLTMILAHADNIREVMAFPKTASANCLMSKAPSTVEEKQLEELNIKITN